MASITRRGALASATTLALGGTLPLFNIRRAAADAPQFKLKLGDDNPATHPLAVRAQEAADRIKKDSNGRVEIAIFNNNALGGDTDMLSQLRAGALEMMTLSGNILSTLVPTSSLYGIAFAFKNYDEVWKAMDGDMGALLRRDINRVGLHVMDKIWNNGFRQISSSTHPIKVPDDLHGFKIRVPISPLWTSTFQAFGASPVSINFSEVYSALQTHIADGQENALILIDTAKLYEVQKYISMTNHMWDGYWLLVNGRIWSSIPPDLQKIISDNLNQSALQERQDVIDIDKGERPKLEKFGMIFNDTDPAQFQAALKKAGFYEYWKKKYGTEAWDVLAKYAPGVA